MKIEIRQTDRQIARQGHTEVVLMIKERLLFSKETLVIPSIVHCGTFSSKNNFS